MKRPAGMPDELWTRVKAATVETRQVMLANWDDIGDNGRILLARYVTKGRFRRTRRERGRLAAEQLIRPSMRPPVGPGAAGTWI